MLYSAQVNSKIELGQFYTRKSPFQYERFIKWFRSIPDFPKIKLIEPFAGSNAIVKMILEDFQEIVAKQWSAFDIQPEAQELNLVPELKLLELDTLNSFPDGYDVAITNPPYLAKNSATRKGSDISFGIYQDLFELSLERMLTKCKYVAAIIPESFITRGLFQERLEAVISLNTEMFEDTEFPVCLAMFSKEKSSNFEIWRGNNFLGHFTELSEKVEKLLVNVAPRIFKFNDPKGILGLTAIDSTIKPTIRFRVGSEIPEINIKVSSRAETRISSSLFQKSFPINELIDEANVILSKYREVSYDVFLTSFKGLRADGAYRRRLDWDTSARILGTAILNIDPKLESLVTPGTRLF
jgi:hypothetical protein